MNWKARSSIVAAVIDRRYSRALIVRLICLAIMFLCYSASAQEASVRATVATNEIWVGERLILQVELFAPGFFDSAPSFDFPDPPNLILLPPAEHPLIRSEQLNGTHYVVQSYELAVFARRAGEQIIPPLTVTFQFKRNPLDKDAETATLKTEPVHFASRLPPGAENLGNLISARDLKTTETWQPPPGTNNLKAGDAFTRTITFIAPNIPGMAFPSFPAGAVDGLSIYPKPPEVLDQPGRGTIRGERRDTLTYVCNRPGRFVIPAVQLVWFDLESQQLRTNTFPAYVLNVRPNPALASTAATTNPITGTAFVSKLEKFPAMIALGGLAALVFLAWLFWKLRCLWLPMTTPFRPVHLAPLNPETKSKPL